jgi:hypothetical protein
MTLSRTAPVQYTLVCAHLDTVVERGLAHLQQQEVLVLLNTLLHTFKLLSTGSGII